MSDTIPPELPSGPVTTEPPPFEPGKTQPLKPLTPEDVVDLFQRFSVSLMAKLDARDANVVSMFRELRDQFSKEHEKLWQRTNQIAIEVDGHGVWIKELRDRMHAHAGEITTLLGQRSEFFDELADLKTRVKTLEVGARRDTEMRPPPLSEPPKANG